MSAGAEHGITRIGGRAYATVATESGWIANTVPAIYSGDAMAPIYASPPATVERTSILRNIVTLVSGPFLPPPWPCMGWQTPSPANRLPRIEIVHEPGMKMAAIRSP